MLHNSRLDAVVCCALRNRGGGDGAAGEGSYYWGGNILFLQACVLDGRARSRFCFFGSQHVKEETNGEKKVP